MNLLRYKYVRYLGILIILIAIFYPIYRALETKPALNAAGAGKRCGGNILNAPACIAGYHCAPVPGVKVPFGDVGGLCVKDK